MPFIVQTIMVDEASFKVTASGARKAADSPVQCVLSSLLVKRDSQAVPELVNLHRPLQLMQNKPTNKKRRTEKQRSTNKTNNGTTKANNSRRAPCMWAALRSQLGVQLDGGLALWPPAAAADLRGLSLGSDGCEAPIRL